MSERTPQSIYEAFRKLENERATSSDNYPAIPVGAQKNEREVLLSKDEYGQFNLLIQLPEGQPQPDILLGHVLLTTWETYNGDIGESIIFLRVTCTEARLVRTFQSLVTEMLLNLYAAQSNKPAIIEFVQVAEFWRKILQERFREYSLSTALGIFGELTVLKELATINQTQALQAWRGTENYRHDFTLTNALEVKTYTSFNEPKITVHGASQLDPASGHSLHLYALHVDQNEDGTTLLDLIEEISDLGIPQRSILQRLSMSEESLKEINYRFITEEQRLYLVQETFPGIRASKIGSESLQGVSDVQYSLNLDVCGPSLDVTELPRILRGL